MFTYSCKIKHLSFSQNKLLPAFTLVELIVVITIVGILSTVGFVSYSGYLTGARDSNRMSQLTKLSDSLQVYAATKSLPLPDNAINITASGSTNVIAYQGELGTDVLETIDYTNGGTDPKDDSYFTYYLTKDRKSLQLMALMEEESSLVGINNEFISWNITDTVNANFEDRYPKVYGKKLGIITQDITNIPANQLNSIQIAGYFDLFLETDSYKAHLSDDEKLTGNGLVLRSAIHNINCNRIKQTGKSRGTGYYTANNLNGSELDIYCEMDLAGGGWMLVTRSHPQSLDSYNTHGNVRDDTYSYRSELGNIFYSISDTDDLFTGNKVLFSLLATYTEGKNIDIAVEEKVISNFSTGETVKICRDIVGDSGVLSDCSNLPTEDLTGYDSSGDSNMRNRQFMIFTKEYLDQ